MKNILFTFLNLNGFHGSVMYIAEIAEYLISKGYNVHCCVFNKEKKYQLFYESKNIIVYDINNIDKKITYDYIFSFHYPVLSILLTRGIKYKKIIPFSLSPFLSIEKPPVYYEQLNNIIAVSKEIKDKFVSAYNINENKISVYPNFAPKEFFDYPKNEKNQTPKKIIVVSNHVPNEILKLRKILESNEINCIIYGKNHTHEAITPKILASADIIISIGKTIQYGLAMGIPCYNYDHFGGSGFITKENINIEEYYNFSGRSFKTKKDEKTIFNEIINNYNNTLDQVDELKQIAYERYYLPSNIENIMLNAVENNIEAENIKHIPKHGMLWELQKQIFPFNFLYKLLSFIKRFLKKIITKCRTSLLGK